ncbi:hypothetical protein Hanom_Chr14g01297381 [Helianthus anomalus]
MSRALARLNDVEVSSSRVFSSFKVVLKIVRAELELWVLLASRARAQISRLKPSRARAWSSSDSARLVYTPTLNICMNNPWAYFILPKYTVNCQLDLRFYHHNQKKKVLRCTNRSG